MDLGVVFFIGLSLSVVAFAISWRKQSIGAAIAVGCAFAMLSPTWVKFNVAGSPISVRWTFIAIAMLCFALTHFRQIRTPLVLTDLFVAGMVIAHIASEYYHEGASFLLPLRAYFEWALPYIAGRYAMLYHRNYRTIGIAFACVGIVIGVLAAFESLTGANAWETLLVEADDEVKRPVAKRFNLLYRAHGPFQHPIFLGIVMLLLIPWSVIAVSIGNTTWTKVVGTLGIFGCILGVVASASRGPLVALFIAILFGMFVWNRYLRYTIAAAMIAGIILATAFPSKLLEIADSTENTELRGKTVAIDGEIEVYTGTRARLFVWRVYGPLVLRGGLLGFGNQAASTFPPNIPGLPAEVSSRETLGYVDNSYLLTGLRFGLAGCFFFTLIILSAITSALRLMRDGAELFYPKEKLIFLVFAAILCAVAIEILTVFSSYDFIFLILFTTGCVAGLRIAAKAKATQ